MDILFTPWRYEYVSTVDKRVGCIFCEKPSESDDRANLVLHRGERAFIMLNLYPYSTGHVMVAPYQHVETIEKLDSRTVLEMMEQASLAMKAIRETFSPEGFNLGINIARVAGAGITDHVHLHVVPRWAGDSNFMSVISHTRVLPMSLDEVWLALKDRIED